jgi:hypothetical protein
MLYQLRVNGHVFGTYATLEEALERARLAMKVDCDFEPEIVDERTGRACLVAGSARWRDELANKIGY